MKKRILFHSYQLSERGTEVALLDYAINNEAILGNTSICLFPRARILSPALNERLGKLFQMEYYDSIQDWDSIAARVKADGLYTIRPGGGDGKTELPSRIPSFVHCVFDTRRPYGKVSASISAYLNKRFHTTLPVMPHIVERKSAAKDDLRKELGILGTARVFGCYGGPYSFSVPLAQRAVARVARSSPDIAFVFLNIQAFCKEPNVFFLPGTTDLDRKQAFINTCDAMVHAREEGETFGLSVAEFFISGKPVLSYKPRLDIRRRYDSAHLDILGPEARTFGSGRELETLLKGFRKQILGEAVIQATYLKPFSKESVMATFDRLFASTL